VSMHNTYANFTTTSYRVATAISATISGFGFALPNNRFFNTTMTNSNPFYLDYNDTGDTRYAWAALDMDGTASGVVLQYNSI
jgi:hypothetical protein